MAGHCPRLYWDGAYHAVYSCVTSWNLRSSEFQMHLAQRVSNRFGDVFPLLTHSREHVSFTLRLGSGYSILLSSIFIPSTASLVASSWPLSPGPPLPPWSVPVHIAIKFQTAGAIVVCGWWKCPRACLLPTVFSRPSFAFSPVAILASLLFLELMRYFSVSGLLHVSFPQLSVTGAFWPFWFLL